LKGLLSDPRAFPAFILVLYAATTVRYAVARDWGRVMYWACAMGITFSAAFLMGQK
jgi:hypothetical protein